MNFALTQTLYQNRYNAHLSIQCAQIQLYLEWTSHLAKVLIIYFHCEFWPLGGTIIEESAFWLIADIYFIAHSKTLYPCVP